MLCLVETCALLLALNLDIVVDVVRIIVRGHNSELIIDAVRLFRCRAIHVEPPTQVKSENVLRLLANKSGKKLGSLEEAYQSQIR